MAKLKFLCTLLVCSLIISIFQTVNAQWWEEVIGGTLENDNPGKVSQTWTSDKDARFKVPTYANYYTVLAIKNRVAGEDFDLFVYNNYELTQKIGQSVLPKDKVDAVIIDGREWGGGYKYAMVSIWSGEWSNGIYIESDCHSTNLFGTDPEGSNPGELSVGYIRQSNFEDGIYPAGTIQSGRPLINAYDVKLYEGGTYYFRVFNIGAALALTANLYKGTTTIDRYLATGSAGGGGTIQYTYYPTATGYYCWLVVDDNLNPGDYRVHVYSDLTVSATPSSQLTNTTLPVSYLVTIASKGVVSPVQISSSWIGANPGGTVTLTNTTVVPRGVMNNYTTVTVSPPAVGFTPGTYTLRITADDTSDSPLPARYVDVTLVVSTERIFTLSASPTERSVSPGNSATFTINIQTINGFDYPVILDNPNSATLAASYITADWFVPNPVPTAGAPPYTATLTVNTSVGGATPTGTYTIVIRGSNQTVGTSPTSQTTVTLRVNPPMVVSIKDPYQNQIIAGVYTFAVEASTTPPNYVAAVSLTFTGTMASAGTLPAYYNSATGYWEREVNTNAYNDGGAAVYATATDAYGSTTTVGPRNFTISNIAPSPQITSPKDRAYVTGSGVPIIVNTTSDVNYVQFRIDLNAFRPLTGGPPTWTFPGGWDSTETTDGAHTLTVRAKNAAGLVGDTMITIYVDNTPPSTYVAVPLPDQYVEGMFTFRISAQDIVAVKNVSISVFGGTVPTAYNTQTGYWEYTVGTSLFPDGTYYVNAIAYDMVLHSNVSSTVRFFVDNLPPTLIPLTPTDGVTVGGSAYNITISSEDVHLTKVEYRVDTGPWVKMNGSVPNFYSIWNTTSVPDGRHQITFKATDRAAHTTEVIVNVYVDNTVPQCTIAAPSPNDFVGSVYTFRVSASDVVGIDRVVVNVFNTTATATYNMQNGYYEYIINTIPFRDGLYNITATAYDKSGKYNTTTKTFFKLDNNPPELVVHSPRDYEYVRGNVQINVSASDSFPRAYNYTEYNIDCLRWVSTAVPWDTTAVGDGLHMIYIRATDDAGHITQLAQPIKVWVDNNLPVCAINAPLQGDFVRNILTFKITATDNVSIAKVYITISNYTTGFNVTLEAAYNSQSGYYEYATDTTARSDGIYKAVVTVYDSAGYVNTAKVEFKINNKPPVLKIISPLNGAYVEGNVFINVTAIDVFPRATNYTEYNVDNTGWQSTTIVWDTTQLPGTDKECTVEIRATDEGGLVTSQIIKVTVDNHPPVCTVYAPSTDEYISGMYTFKSYAVDTIGLTKVVLTIYNSTYNKTVYMVLSGGYYVYTEPTIGYSDDVYYAVVTATDYSNKSTTSSVVKFMIDNHPPALDIIYPTPDIFVEGNVTINATITDRFPNDPTPLQYDIDESESWQNISVPWQTKFFSDGNHLIRVKATDKYGHTTIKKISVIVDNNPPVVKLQSPQPNEDVTGDYAIQIYATDRVGIDYVLVAITGVPALSGFATFNTITQAYTYTLKTTTWEEDGVHYINVTAVDYSGKSGQTPTIKFNVDNCPPKIKIEKPLHGQFVEGKFVIETTVIEKFIGPVQYRIDDLGGIDMEGVWEIGNIKRLNKTWDTTPFDDGRHKVTITATDWVGHYSEQCVEVIVDNHPPICMITEPTEGQFIEGLYTVKVYAKDNVSVSAVTTKIFQFEKTASYNLQTGYYEFTVPTQLQKDGLYNITAIAKDASNKTTIAKPVSFYVDNLPPKLTIIKPLEKDYVTGIYRINVTVEELFLDRVEYNVDGSGWVPIDRDWDTTALQDGVHTLRIRAVDKIGHMYEESLSVVTDNTAPIISPVSPVENAYINSKYPFRIFATDSIGIAQLRVKIQQFETDLYPTAGNYYDYTFDTTAFPDGKCLVVLTATDLAGLHTYKSITVYIDNTGPVISILSPTGTVQGQVMFEVSATDKGVGNVSSVLLNIDGTGWREMLRVAKTDRYTYVWSTTEQMNGPHVFEVKAIDALGNEMLAVGSVTVGNPIVPDYFRAFLDIIPLIAFLFSVAFIIVLLFLFRRRIRRFLREEKMLEEKAKQKPAQELPQLRRYLRRLPPTPPPSPPPSTPPPPPPTLPGQQAQK